MKKDNNCICEEETGFDVSCTYHGQEALKNKTGYYKVTKCKTCLDTTFIRQNSKKFPIIKCPFCR